MNLDDPRALAQVDPHDARRALADFPAQCRAARALAAAPPLGVRSPRVVALTAGGALAQRAAAAGRPRVTLPGGLMPRMALGYLFLPAVALLAGCGVAVATPAEVDEAVDAVEALATELVPERPAGDNEAKRLALSIGDRLPVIYGGPT